MSLLDRVAVTMASARAAYNKMLDDFEWLQSTGSAAHQFASATALEAADYSSADHDFIMKPKAILCNKAGSIKLDTVNSNAITVPLQTGYNPIAATKIYNLGSDPGITIIGMDW